MHRQTRAQRSRRPADSRGRPVMAAKAVPLTQRAAWKALGEHYEKIRNVHLRSLFADDPGRGERFAVEGCRAVPRLLQASHHRRDDAPAARPGRGVGAGGADRSDVLGRENQRHGESRRPARGAARAARRLDHGRRRERGAQGPRGARSDVGASRAAFATGRGRDTPASASATSSISESAARTWVR